jgi:hypothetical protein
MSPARTSKRVKMSPAIDHKRAVRIAGCSGGFLDRANAITRMAGDPEVDVVMGKLGPQNHVQREAHHNRGLAFGNDNDSTW